jgi:hypothetical protein
MSMWCYRLGPELLVLRICYAAPGMAAFAQQDRFNGRIDWSILRDRGVALYRRREIFDEDVGWFLQQNYQVSPLTVGDGRPTGKCTRISSGLFRFRRIMA